MKKRVLSAILALSILMTLPLGGCAAKTEPTAAAAVPVQTTVSAAVEPETTEAPVETRPQKKELTPQGVQDLVIAEVEEPSDEIEPLPTGDPSWEKIPVELMTLGDIAELAPAEDPVEVTEEEATALNRSSKAIVPAYSPYFVNKARTYYYYSQLDDNARGIYDAMYKLFINPRGTEYVTSAMLDYAPSGIQLSVDENLAFAAIRYDHPELFWPYTMDHRPYSLKYSNGERIGSYYPVYLSLREPNYQAEQWGVNLAAVADKFLSMIPQNIPDEQKVRKVHDLLVWNVTYDHPTADLHDRYNLAHFAYGALFQNSSGEDFHAVCDGYALGFLYLLQQLGIEATVVSGEAGSPGDMGGHAWSLVKLNGKWGEYDVTWDDPDDWTAKHSPSDKYYSFYVDAWNNASYRELVTHAFYNISTSRMNHFVSGDEFRFYSNKSSMDFVGDSQRERYTLLTSWFYGPLMEYAPIAY